VVSWKDERLRSAGELNGLLPADVAILHSEQAPEAFNARADALSRSYVYRILNRPVIDPRRRRFELHHPRRLDDELLTACAEAIAGRHDFRAFTPSETQHRFFERTVVDGRWVREGDRLTFHITANALLRHMVRILVGTMLDAPDPQRFAEMLKGAPRSAAGRTAPPHGLTLVSVGYDGWSSAEATSSARP
jgi:tRNA pseudouridine38-40 synthase